MRNHRHNKRMKVSRRVDFEYDGKATFAFTRDISAGGAFLRTSGVLPLDVELNLAINLEQDKEPVVVRARVIRTETGGLESGFGVRFVEQGQDAVLDRIAEFVLGSIQDKAQERSERNPYDTRSLQDLAEIASECGDLDAAKGYLERIIDVDRDSPAHGMLAEILLEQALAGELKELFEEASAVYDKACELDPEGGFEQGRETCRRHLQAFSRQLDQAERKCREQEEARQREIDRSLREAEQLEAQRREVEALLQSVGEKEQSLVGQAAQQDQARTELADQQEREEEARAQAADLERKRHILDQERSQLEQRREVLDDLRTQLDQKAADLTAREATLDEKEGELEDREWEMTELKNNLIQEREKLAKAQQGAGAADSADSDQAQVE